MNIVNKNIAKENKRKRERDSERKREKKIRENKS